MATNIFRTEGPIGLYAGCGALLPTPVSTAPSRAAAGRACDLLPCAESRRRRPHRGCAAAPTSRRLSASVTRQATYGTARIGLHSVFSDKLKAANGVSALLACSSA